MISKAFGQEQLQEMMAVQDSLENNLETAFLLRAHGEKFYRQERWGQA